MSSKIQTRKQDGQYKGGKCCWSIQDEKKNNAENKGRHSLPNVPMKIFMKIHDTWMLKQSAVGLRKVKP